MKKIIFFTTLLISINTFAIFEFKPINCKNYDCLAVAGVNTVGVDVPFKDKEPLGAKSEVTPKYGPITDALPIWRKKIEKMGIKLPLPFGVGINLAYINQGLSLSEVALGIDSAPEPTGITFDESRDIAFASIARADFWLFPFLNLYGLGGYLNGEADLNINIPADPILGTTKPSMLNLNLDYHGYQLGVGATAAMGYKNFFAVVDFNYSWAKINIIEDVVGAVTVSPKAGIIIETKDVTGTGAIYIGAMYLNYSTTFTGSVPAEVLDPILTGSDLNYAVSADPKKPWNFVFGGNWEFNPKWSLIAEIGIGNRKQFIAGGIFRF